MTVALWLAFGTGLIAGIVLATVYWLAWMYLAMKPAVPRKPQGRDNPRRRFRDILRARIAVLIRTARMTERRP